MPGSYAFLSQVRPTSRQGPALLVGLLLAGTPMLAAQSPPAASTPRSSSGAATGLPAIDVAQRSFYNGKYESAAADALALRTADATNLSAYELRTSALHFQLKRALGDEADADKAFKACTSCPAILAAFLDDVSRGQAAAKAELSRHPNEESALFFLGKIDLNYVWLELGTLGHRTGWNEFREARRTLDTVLKANPRHTRAQIAHAWIDYIVDTRVPRLFRWILGGGDKKKGLRVVKEASTTATDFFTRAEATFGLWEMQIRERDFAGAVVTARALAVDFPENTELAAFLAAHAAR